MQGGIPPSSDEKSLLVFSPEGSKWVFRALAGGHTLGARRGRFSPISPLDAGIPGGSIRGESLARLPSFLLRKEGLNFKLRGPALLDQAPLAGAGLARFSR